jgi:hypothetical protein
MCQESHLARLPRRTVFHIYQWYIPTRKATVKVATAKLFMNGRSQAVRLPREFRFDGEELRIRRVGRGVML